MIGLLAPPAAPVDDPAMPFLARALTPVAIQSEIVSQLPELAGPAGRLAVESAHLLRHKPGRRCLIAYQLLIERPGERPTSVALLGKARAKGLDRTGYGVQRALWRAGYRVGGGRPFAVPEPIGCLPTLNLWLQRRVSGTAVSQRLAEPGQDGLARRLAEAAHALHQVGPPTIRQHRLADELLILHQRLRALAERQPTWASRLDRVLADCVRLAARIPAGPSHGIHRDYYPDQALIDGDELYLLDFDLYCAGDPALDIGNCIGHLIEQSLRQTGAPDSLAGPAQALAERFFELAGPSERAAVRAYTTLTLVRHIELSTRLTGRATTTTRLLDLCEERLRGSG